MAKIINQLIKFGLGHHICDPVSLINYTGGKMSKITQNAPKHRQKYAEILKISANIYKNLRKYDNNWQKLPSVKTQPPRHLCSYNQNHSAARQCYSMTDVSYTVSHGTTISFI